MDKENLSLILFIVFVAVAFGVFVWNIAATVADRKRNSRWMRNFENKWNSMTKFTDDEATWIRIAAQSQISDIKSGKYHFGTLPDNVKEEEVEMLESIVKKIEEMNVETKWGENKAKKEMKE